MHISCEHTIVFEIVCEVVSLLGSKAIIRLSMSRISFLQATYLLLPCHTGPLNEYNPPLNYADFIFP